MPRYDDEQDGRAMLVEGLLQGSTDGLIEAAEARGQVALVNSSDLPIEMRPQIDEVAKKTGIIFGEKINDLFIEATLPGGWSKRATEHPMHSDLIDDKGRVRAAIFYKAAYYDRKANMYFKPFYRVEVDYDKHDVRVINANGEMIKDFGRVDVPEDHNDPSWLERIKEHDNLINSASKWLTENYPERDDPFTYWD